MRAGRRFNAIWRPSMGAASTVMIGAALLLGVAFAAPPHEPRLGGVDPALVGEWAAPGSFHGTGHVWSLVLFSDGRFERGWWSVPCPDPSVKPKVEKSASDAPPSAVKQGRPAPARPEALRFTQGRWGVRAGSLHLTEVARTTLVGARPLLDEPSGICAMTGGVTRQTVHRRSVVERLELTPCAADEKEDAGPFACLMMGTQPQVKSGRGARPRLESGAARWPPSLRSEPALTPGALATWLTKAAGLAGPRLAAILDPEHGLELIIAEEDPERPPDFRWVTQRLEPGETRTKVLEQLRVTLHAITTGPAETACDPKPLTCTLTMESGATAEVAFTRRGAGLHLRRVREPAPE